MYLDCREAFLDAQAQVECEEEDADDGQETSIVNNRSLSTVPSDVLLEGMIGNSTGTMHTCTHCIRTFRYEHNLREHEEVCSEGTDGVVAQSTLHRAAEIASRLVYEGSIEHDTIYNPLGQ